MKLWRLDSYQPRSSMSRATSPASLTTTYTLPLACDGILGQGPMNDDEKKDITNEVDSREPYEPPKLECEELFEKLALACGKIQPVTHNCRMGKNRLS
jgi:hypothetical protein